MMVSRERPILFNEFSMRAFLAERKRQTRRTRGLDVVNEDPDAWILQDLSLDPTLMDENGDPFIKKGLIATFEHKEIGDCFVNVRCPYGQPGDVLYGRETWATDAVGSNGHFDYIKPSELPKNAPLHYRADILRSNKWRVARWRPSIHMPRWASRLDCELLSVGIERVQAISAHDAICEGIVPAGYMGDPCDVADSAKDDFRLLWDSINFDRGLGWDVNPWNWVLELDPVLRG